MENTREIIANNIIKYRKLIGLTQMELAEKLNYSDKAVSKWERGDALPDVIVLKEMANLFGISLDALASNQTESPRKIKSLITKIYTNKMLISASATLLVWLVATILFAVLTLFTSIPKLWLIFIFSIPINIIILLCLTKYWKSNWYNFILSSLLVISLALCAELAFNYENLWLLFIVCVPLVLLSFLLFIVRHKVIRIHRKKK